MLFISILGGNEHGKAAGDGCHFPIRAKHKEFIVARLTFWISSFLPNSVSGYTIKIGAGAHSGKTAIPLPSLARLWPGNVLKPWSTGYLTDQRGFSNSPMASARMRSLIVIETTTMTEVSQSHKSSGTTEVDLSSGAQEGFAIANMSRCKYRANPAMTSYAFYRKLEASAGDPLVGMAADIDYKGTLIVTRHGVGPGAKVVVDFEGMVDNFPAYECYASLNGVTNTLFVRPPPAANTVVDLLGGANNPVAGRATF